MALKNFLRIRLYIIVSKFFIMMFLKYLVIIEQLFCVKDNYDGTYYLAIEHFLGGKIYS